MGTYRYLSSNYYQEPDDLPREYLRCQSCGRFLRRDTKPVEYRRQFPVLMYNEDGDIVGYEETEMLWIEERYLCERCSDLH